MEFLKKYALIIAMLAAGGMWTVACSGGGDGDGDGDADGDGDGDGDNALEFVSAQNQFLTHGELTDLTVRYVDGTGMPIRNAQISYDMDTGRAGGSTLPARNAQTGDDGTATMELTAGMTNATFDVQVTPPIGDAIAFHMSVSDTLVGSIVITMLYAGEETFTNFQPYLFVGETCDTMDPEALPTAESIGAAVTHLEDEPRFDGLEPANDYAVAVVAEIDGNVRGFGCNDGVMVGGNQVTEVTMNMRDIIQIIRFEGVYDIDSYLDFGDALPPSVESALRIFSELGDDHDPDRDPADNRVTPPDMAGQDPGAFLMDVVMRMTCDWECGPGEDDYGDCTLGHPWGDLRMVYEEDFQSTSYDGAQARFIGGCGVWQMFGNEAQAFINDQIEALSLDVVVGVLNILSDLSTAIIRAHILSELTIEEYAELGAPFTHELTEMVVRLRDWEGAYSDYRFALADAGLTSLTAAETAGVDGTTLTLPDHSFELHFGQLLQYIYLNGVLPLLGYVDTADMLASWINCASIATTVHGWIYSLVGFNPVSEAQLEDWCGDGLDAGGNAIEDLIVDSVDASVNLALAGTANGTAIDDDGLVHELEDGIWDGGWTEGAITGDITGEFTGTLQE